MRLFDSYLLKTFMKNRNTFTEHQELTMVYNKNSIRDESKKC